MKNGKRLPSKLKIYPFLALVVTAIANAMLLSSLIPVLGICNSLYDSVSENKEPPEVLESSWLGHSFDKLHSLL